MRARRTLGHQIKELRLAALMTQKDLAHRLGVEPVTVSRWERDEVPPSDLNRVKLARLFDVNADLFRRKAAA